MPPTIPRQPLTEIKNDRSNRPRIKAVYGKTGRASASVRAAKAIFTMAEEVESKLASLQIAEEEVVVRKEEKKEKENAVPARSSRPRLSILNIEFDRFADGGEVPILSFEEYAQKVGKKYRVEKLGEGSFSSVFVLTNKSNDRDMTVIKLIPLQLAGSKRIRDGTTISGVVSELEVLKLLSDFHGFIAYRGLTICHGSWPHLFLEAFRDFGQKYASKAENEDPNKLYTDQQHYVVIEMEHAGIEIGDLKGPSFFQIYDIFWMTVIHIACAEQVHLFEHRDLHNSNICVKARDLKNDNMDVVSSVVSSMETPPSRILGMSNACVTLIDYTYSRCDLTDVRDDTIHEVDRRVAYREWQTAPSTYDTMVRQNFLWDEGKYGQDEVDSRGRLRRRGYPFEVRLQRYTYQKVTKVVENNYDGLLASGKLADVAPKKTAQWRQSATKSNVCWLGYLAVMLCNQALRVPVPRYIEGSTETAIAVQDALRDVMVEVRKFLMDDKLDGLPSSADALLKVGVERGWVQQPDVDAFMKMLDESG